MHTGQQKHIGMFIPLMIDENHILFRRTSNRACHSIWWTPLLDVLLLYAFLVFARGCISLIFRNSKLFSKRMESGGSDRPTLQELPDLLLTTSASSLMSDVGRKNHVDSCCNWSTTTDRKKNFLVPSLKHWLQYTLFFLLSISLLCRAWFFQALVPLNHFLLIWSTPWNVIKLIYIFGIHEFSSWVRNRFRQVFGRY